MRKKVIGTIALCISLILVTTFNINKDVKVNNNIAVATNEGQSKWNMYWPQFKNVANKRCLEIGAYKGFSAKYTIENICNGENSILDAIDLWATQSITQRTYKNENYNNDPYSEFYNNLKDYIDNKKIMAHKGDSFTILNQFNIDLQKSERQKYDFIYIDGSHFAKDVLSDAILAWNLLNVGGIMIFDDYEWNFFPESPWLKPQVAIDGFLKAYETLYEITHKGYQLHIKKIADWYKIPANF